MLVGLLPGLLLTGGIAAAGFALNKLPFVSIFSPLILSILIGILLRNTIGVPAGTQAGITFSLRKILRFAIIMLGLQLTVAQIGQVGIAGVAVIGLTLVSTFVFTIYVGRWMGIEPKLTQLIAAGTSICGASAVIAVDAVTNAPDEDVAYAVACVTIFGSAAMFIYPELPALLHLSASAYGLWAGASIHEIAQVVAATFQHGHQAGDIGTIAKLTRVGMLAPVVLSLGFLATRRLRRSGAGEPTVAAKAPIPWFVFGFLALMGFNSVLPITGTPKLWIISATTFLLSVALAAMGLETDMRKLRAKGWRPLLLGLAAFLFIATFSLGLVKIIA
jgi:uncharacterized integral membrane protein (TIGR00698 family)